MLTAPNEDVRKSYIAQIEAEDGLVAQRMGWMLQFNGFLIASFGLAAREGAAVHPVQTFLQSVPWMGLAVTILGATGIWAALSAANLKRSEWLEWMAGNDFYDAARPTSRPLFLSGGLSWYASSANAIGLPAVIATFWLWMLIGGG